MQQKVMEHFEVQSAKFNEIANVRPKYCIFFHRMKTVMLKDVQYNKV